MIKNIIFCSLFFMGSSTFGIEQKYLDLLTLIQKGLTPPNKKIKGWNTCCLNPWIKKDASYVIRLMRCDQKLSGSYEMQTKVYYEPVDLKQLLLGLKSEFQPEELQKLLTDIFKMFASSNDSRIYIKDELISSLKNVRFDVLDNQ